MPDNNKRVQFNEPTVLRQRGPRKSWSINLIIKLGLAKDEKQASIVLIAIGILALVVMVVFWPRSNNQPTPPPATTTQTANIQ